MTDLADGNKASKKKGYRNWKSIPGGFDALNTKHLYPSHNSWGIPEIPHAPLSVIPQWLSPYRTRLKADQDPSTGALHFFLNDYQFESIWRRPVQTLKGLQNTWSVVLGPDFSLFYDCPPVMQLWNTYRSRWVARWWVENGLIVIPTVAWASPDSWDFCFLGLPSRSVLAVSVLGTKNDPVGELAFLLGFEEMLKRLTPTAVICYGKPYSQMEAMADLHTYPTFWDSVGVRRRKYGQKNDDDNAPKLPDYEIEIDI
jgi:hypothetical protein